MITMIKSAFLENSLKICPVSILKTHSLKWPFIPSNPSGIKAGKMKSRRAVSKRFRATGAGRIIRSQCGKKHLNEKKTRTRKNNLSAYKVLVGKEAKNVS